MRKSARRKTALVTGGAGFIGGSLIEALLSRGWSVTSLDLYSSARPFDAVRYIRGDVRNADAVMSALQGCERVFHLAAAHHDSGISEQTYFDVNEHGTRVLTQTMAALGISDLCFYSTVAVYGAAAMPATEATVPQPVSAYGASKLAAERVVEEWYSQENGRRALIIRPSVVFGPNNFANMFSLMRAIDKRLYLQVGGGTNKKSLTYVANLVDATLHAIDHSGRSAYELFNYADKPDLTSSDIATIVSAALARTKPRLSIPLWVALLAATPFDLISHFLQRDFSISRSRVRKFSEFSTVFAADRIQSLGFFAPVTLPDGLRLMADWYRNSGREQPRVRRLPPRQSTQEILVEV